MMSKCALAVVAVAVVSLVANAQLASPVCPVAQWAMNALPGGGVTVIESVVTEATVEACAVRAKANAECLAFAFHSDGGVNTCQLYSAATVPDTIQAGGAIAFYLTDCCAGHGIMTAANTVESDVGEWHQCLGASERFNDAISVSMDAVGKCKVHHGPAITGLVKGEEGVVVRAIQPGTLGGFCPDPSVAALATDLVRFETTFMVTQYEGTEISKTEYVADNAYSCMESCRTNKSCLGVAFSLSEGKPYCSPMSAITAVKPYVKGDSPHMVALPANCIYDKKISGGTALPVITALSAEHCAQRTYLSVSDGAKFFVFDTTVDKDNCHRYASLTHIEAANGMITGTLAGCRSMADYGRSSPNGSSTGRFGSVASSLLALAATVAGFAMFIF